MKTSTKRRLALVMSLSLLAALASVSATPAAANELNAAGCQTLLKTTPGIEVDLNDDGNPEFRAPRIYDVVLCSDVTYGYVTYPPTIENCSGVPKSVRCMAVRFTILPAFASAHAGGEICFTIEGSPRQCEPFDSGDSTGHNPRTVCIGYDLDGGHPCDGQLVSLS
jgi:hypothetical protein